MAYSGTQRGHFSAHGTTLRKLAFAVKETAPSSTTDLEADSVDLYVWDVPHDVYTWVTEEDVYLWRTGADVFTWSKDADTYLWRAEFNVLE